MQGLMTFLHNITRKKSNHSNLSGDFSFPGTGPEKARHFLTPPPPDSSEEEMAKFAIEQEKGTVNFYLSFEKAFPDAWKKMHIQKMVIEEQSHANDLIAAYPQFKDIVV